jgi:hypothetical protein
MRQGIVAACLLADLRRKGVVTGPVFYAAGVARGCILLIHLIAPDEKPQAS